MAGSLMRTMMTWRQGPLHTFEQRTLYTLKRLVKPVTSYVFQQLEQRFSTATPTLMAMDEAAITAALPAYADKYDEWLMVTRKKSVSLGFLINALHQITDEGTELSALGRMLQVNCPSRYFLPNAEALTPIMQTVYRHFGLTETEMQMLATARPTQDLYYSCRELGQRLLHLKLSPFVLDTLARNTQKDHAAHGHVTRNGRARKALPGRGLTIMAITTPRRRWKGTDMRYLLLCLLACSVLTGCAR